MYIRLPKFLRVIVLCTGVGVSLAGCNGYPLTTSISTIQKNVYAWSDKWVWVQGRVGAVYFVSDLNVWNYVIKEGRDEIVIFINVKRVVPKVGDVVRVYGVMLPQTPESRFAGTPKLVDYYHAVLRSQTPL